METTKSKKKWIPIAIILIVFVVGCIGIWWAITYASSPKSVLLSELSRWADNLNGLNQTEEYPALQFLKEQDAIQTTANIHLESEELSILGLSNADIEMSYLKNISAKKNDITFDMQVNGERLFGMSALQDNDRIYFRIFDTIDTYLYQTQEFVSLTSAMETVDYRVFTDSFVKAIDKTVKEEDMEEEKVTIDVIGQEMELNRYSYTINRDRLITLLETYMDLLLANENASTYFMTMLQISSKEGVRNYFGTKFIAPLQLLSDEEMVPLTIAVYAKGMNQVYATELAVEGEVIRYVENEGHGQVLFLENDTEVLTLDIVKENESYQIDGAISDVLNVTGTITPLNQGKSHIDLTLSDSEVAIGLKLDGQIEGEGEVFQSDLTGILSITSQGETISIDMDMSVKQEVGTEVDLSVVEGAKDVNALTEEEQQEWAQSLMNVPLFQLLFIGSTSD